MPRSPALWLLLGVVAVAFGVAAAVTPAQASGTKHYDFFVSRSINLSFQLVISSQFHSCTNIAA